MWFIVKTDVFTEQKSMDLLREKFNDTIVDYYFPMGRRTYTNEKGEEKVRFYPSCKDYSLSEWRVKGVWKDSFPSTATSCIRVLIMEREVMKS